MKLSSLGALLAGLCCGSAAAAAPITFNCTDPLGRSSDFWQVQTGSTYRVRGQIEPRRLDPLPAAPVRTESGDPLPLERGAEVMIQDPSEGTYMIFGVAADLEGRTLEIGASSRQGEQENSVSIENREWRSNTPISIPFEIAVEPERVLIRVGTREIRLDVALGSASEVRIGCIGGTFAFRSLEMNDWTSLPAAL